MRVLVCGGRHFNDLPLLYDMLERMHAKHEFTCVIHGSATAADTWAQMWANTNLVPTEPYPAEWMKEGRAAGRIRDERMLDESKPDLVVAFPGGPETADIVRRARAAGIETIEIRG